jgi:hypothetical protein
MWNIHVPRVCEKPRMVNSHLCARVQSFKRNIYILQARAEFRMESYSSFV